VSHRSCLAHSLSGLGSSFGKVVAGDALFYRRIALSITEVERLGDMTTVNPTAASAPAQQEQLSLYDLFIGILTLLDLVGIALIFLLPSDAAARQVLFIVDSLISVIFLADFFGRLFRAPRKRDYLFWQGVVDFLGSIPALPALRVFRMFQLARIVRILQLGGSKRLVREFINRRAESALYITVILAIILLTVGSMLVLFFELQNPHSNIRTGGDAMWYSIVTITTVGYGDYTPITTGGRLIGVITMFFGIGIFGVLTSFLSSTFISSLKKEEEEAKAPDTLADQTNNASPVVTQPDAAKLESQVAALRAELAEIKELLRARG
jgi:voltage-gated potassium channel